MGSVNVYNSGFPAPASLRLQFTAALAGTADTLFSGSRAALTDHGYTVTRLPGPSTTTFTIIMPVSTSSTELSNVLTDDVKVSALDTEITTVIEPALVTDWTNAGSLDPEGDSKGDTGQDPPPAA